MEQITRTIRDASARAIPADVREVDWFPWPFSHAAVEDFLAAKVSLSSGTFVLLVSGISGEIIYLNEENLEVETQFTL